MLIINVLQRPRIMLSSASTLRQKKSETTVRPTRSTLMIRHENGAFGKRSSNRGIWRRRLYALRLRVDRKQFENRASFEKEGVMKITWFLWPSFPRPQIENDRPLVSPFPRRSVDGKHLLCFQSETFFFKYLWCSVDGSREPEVMLMRSSKPT